MVQDKDLDVLRDIPGYKAILKALIKSQIQHLVEQLSSHTDEEAVLLTVSITDGSLSHLGSESGRHFLDDHEDIKSKFLGFCLKRQHRLQSEESQARSPPPVQPHLSSPPQKRQRFSPFDPANSMSHARNRVKQSPTVRSQLSQQSPATSLSAGLSGELSAGLSGGVGQLQGTPPLEHRGSIVKTETEGNCSDRVGPQSYTGYAVPQGGLDTNYGKALHQEEDSGAGVSDSGGSVNVKTEPGSEEEELTITGVEFHGGGAEFQGGGAESSGQSQADWLNTTDSFGVSNDGLVHDLASSTVTSGMMIDNSEINYPVSYQPFPGQQQKPDTEVQRLTCHLCHPDKCKTFKKKIYLKKHIIKDHLAKNRVAIVVDNSEINNPGSYQPFPVIQQKTSTEGKQLTCNLCCITFKKLKYLIKHNKRKHLANKRSETMVDTSETDNQGSLQFPGNPESPGLFKDSSSGISGIRIDNHEINNPGALQTFPVHHQSPDTEVNRLTCKLCSKTFKRKMYLRKHNKRMHLAKDRSEMVDNSEINNPGSVQPFPGHPEKPALSQESCSGISGLLVDNSQINNPGSVQHYFPVDQENPGLSKESSSGISRILVDSGYKDNPGLYQHFPVDPENSGLSQESSSGISGIMVDSGDKDNPGLYQHISVHPENPGLSQESSSGISGITVDDSEINNQGPIYPVHQPNPDTEVKQLTCNLCCKTFKKLQYLRRHIKMHSEKQMPDNKCFITLSSTGFSEPMSESKESDEKDE